MNGMKYRSPLSIYFVWHHNDSQEVKPLIDYCTALLKRDVNNPFSRNVNIPVFYRTTTGKNVPTEIEDLSKKTLVFAFIGMEIVSDESWIKYLRGITKSSSQLVRVLPIALDQYAYQLDKLFSGVNYIRMKDFGASNRKSRLSIALMHEIFRFALNNYFEKYSEGRRNAIRFFISHSKKDKLAEELANDIKEYIDNTPMNRFLDVVDMDLPRFCGHLNG